MTEKEVVYPVPGSNRCRDVVTVYLPSNGSPSPETLIDAPARSLGLPRATPSNSANVPAISSASEPAASSTSAWVR